MSKTKPTIKKNEATLPALLAGVGVLAGLAVLTIILTLPLAPGMSQVILFYILFFLGGGMATSAVVSRWLDRHDPNGEDPRP